MQQAFGKELLPEIALDTRLVKTQLNGQLEAINADGFELLFTILVIDIATNITAWADPLYLYSANFRVMTCSLVNVMQQSYHQMRSRLHPGNVLV